jgi:hypothetical protein
MIVSYSNFSLYRKCPRQWCFKKMANSRAKDWRREMYLLDQLKSLSAWRGNIVDTVISNWIVPPLNRGFLVSIDTAVAEARRLFDLQLDFARERRWREPGLTKTSAGDAYAAFSVLELHEEVDEGELERAWNDIETALHNFYALEELLDTLRSANYLVSQRALSFSHSDMTVRAVPDLIVFWRDEIPLIVDWKVHAFGNRDARNQLALYALALKNVEPHRDFPRTTVHWNVEQVRLQEVQLLSGECRSYVLSAEDIEDVDSMIAANAAQFKLVADGENPKDWNPWDFPTTRYDEVCTACPFKPLCWRTSSVMTDDDTVDANTVDANINREDLNTTTKLISKNPKSGRSKKVVPKATVAA